MLIFFFLTLCYGWGVFFFTIINIAVCWEDYCLKLITICTRLSDITELSFLPNRQTEHLVSKPGFGWSYRGWPRIEIEMTSEVSTSLTTFWPLLVVGIRRDQYSRITLIGACFKVKLVRKYWFRCHFIRLLSQNMNLKVTFKPHLNSPNLIIGSLSYCTT